MVENVMINSCNDELLVSIHRSYPMGKQSQLELRCIKRATKINNVLSEYLRVSKIFVNCFAFQNVFLAPFLIFGENETREYYYYNNF